MTRADQAALPASWVDLEPSLSVPCDDRGLYYGDGVFETLRYQDGLFLLLERHLNRLSLGCEALGLRHSPDQISSQLSLAITHLQHSGITQACARLTLTRGSGSRGYAPGENASRLLLTLTPISLPWGDIAAPARVQVCSIRLAAQPRLAGIKHGNRLEQVLAAQEVATAGADEGLLLSANGQLISGISNNLFLLLDGEWATPLIEDCGVRGTARDYLLETLGPACGLRMMERAVSREELAQGEAMFLCNSLHGIRSVYQVNDRPYAIHNQIADLQAAWFKSVADTSVGGAGA
jgi:4-amino-4-deoxychorismate lyase